jgi:hypothetical protein
MVALGLGRHPYLLGSHGTDGWMEGRPDDRRQWTLDYGRRTTDGGLDVMTFQISGRLLYIVIHICIYSFSNSEGHH